MKNKEHSKLRRWFLKKSDDTKIAIIGVLYGASIWGFICTVALWMLFPALVLPLFFAILFHAWMHKDAQEHPRDIFKNNSYKGSSNSDEKYEKMFPHITTDDNSSDEDKKVDDYIFMDMMDDD